MCVCVCFGGVFGGGFGVFWRLLVALGVFSLVFDGFLGVSSV